MAGDLFCIALGAFVFVALAVAGCRALDTLAAARRSAPRKPVVTPYRGPVYTRHGRPVSRNGRPIL